MRETKYIEHEKQKSARNVFIYPEWVSTTQNWVSKYMSGTNGYICCYHNYP